MSADTLPLRTRLFGSLLGVVARTPTDSGQMVALRRRRRRLIATGIGGRIIGRDAAGVDVREVAVGDLRLRVHTPPGGEGGPAPVVVNYHGGGWCLGSPEQSRWLASNVAARVGAVVVSPSYRLAPEHPYPAAVDDAWTILQWVWAHAPSLGGDLRRLAVMGDSAGANLAAVLALKARDNGGPTLRGQVLVYPAVELYERWPSEDTHANGPMLTSELMRLFSRLYLGDAYGIEDWQASPIRADSHAGLPPALVVTAGHDPLHDHGERYAQALAAAGVEVEHRDHPRAIHGFLALPGIDPAARPALDQVTTFLRRVL